MIPNWLSLIDVCVVVAVLLFAWGGSQKGFAAQVSHIITFFAMGVVLFFVYPSVFRFLGRVLRGVEDTYIMWLLLAGVVGVAILVFVLVSKLLAGAMQTQISNVADAFWGFVLGLFRGFLVVLIVMVFLVMLDGSRKLYESFREKSYFGRIVCYDMIPRIQPHVSKAVIQEKTNELKQKLLQQEEAGLPSQ